MKQINKTFLLVALAMFAGACVLNMDDERELVSVDDGRVVTLSIAVPGPADSRAMSPEAEGEVSTIDVLLFDKATDKFRYWAIGSNVKPDVTHPEKKSSFSVKLPTETWTVVVLANAREAIAASVYANTPYDELVPATLKTGTISRADLLESLVIKLDPGEKWVDTKKIPMWGYYKKGTTTTLTVDASTSTIAEAINLTRAVARVNISVGVDDADPVRDVFSLENARLYNRNRAGSIAPAASTAGGNVDGYDPSRWNGSKAIKPNVPSSPLLETGAIFYDIDLDDNPATPVYLYEREIYTFETEADATDKICLVIGGYYKGNSSPTYYRVDFVDENEDHLSLLRNHSYHVKIKEVLAAGYASVAEAFDNPPSNIVVTITEDDGAFGLIAFDEQNYLGASAGEVTIRRWADTGHQFSVSTDVADGWEVVGTSATSEFHEGFELTWLTVTSSGLTVGKGNVTFDVDENDTDARRVGYIHLVAGRLHLAVKVVQRLVEVWITGASELVFEPALGVFTGQTFRVHWLPVGAQVSAASIPHSGYPAFAYDSSDDVPGEGALASFGDVSGERDVTFCPAVLTAVEIAANPFVVKSSFARFVAFYNDEFGSTDIEVRQLNYHTSADVNVTYALDGHEHSFIVRSNTEWQISAVSDPQNILQATPVPLSGGNNTAGETVNFKLVTAGTSAEATLTLTDPNGRVGNINVIIKGVAVCGTEGNAVSVRIGNNDYLTHMYGTKCWMVQNSREGTAYSSPAFGKPSGNFYLGYADYSGQSNGHYYIWSQANAANNACPNGWHLPTDTEINALMNAVNIDKTGIGKWWCGEYGASFDAFAGCYNPDTNSWYDWGDRGLWWGAVTNRRFTGTTSTLGDVNTHGTAWFSVRCVQN